MRLAPTNEHVPDRPARDPLKECPVRLSYRLNLSLIAGVAVTSLAFTLYQTMVETRGLRAEAERHAVVLAESLEKPVETLVVKESIEELQKLVERFERNAGLAGIAVYNLSG